MPINPLTNLLWREETQAIAAATNVAPRKFGAVVIHMPVGRNIVRVHLLGAVLGRARYITDINAILF